MSGDGSHAGAFLPYPWRCAALAAGAPIPLSYSLCYRLRGLPALASGAGALSFSSPSCPPRWMEAVGGGSDESLSNKLVGWHDLLVADAFSSSSPCCHGGGQKGQVEEGAGALRSRAPWGVHSESASWSTSSAVCRRLLAALPLTIMAEGRPLQALTPAVYLLILLRCCCPFNLLVTRAGPEGGRKGRPPRAPKS